MKKAGIIWFFALIVLLCVSVTASVLSETKDIEAIKPYLEKENEYLHFSRDDYYSEKEFELEIIADSSVPSSAEIRYTLNGDEPTAKSSLYTSPVLLKEKEDEPLTVIPVRAAVIYKGEVSESMSKTYVICADKELFSKIDVVSIVSDNDALFGYENGILVSGKIYDDFMNSDKAGTVPEWQVPANFKVLRGKDYERLSHVEMFFGGKNIISQYAGLTTAGGASSYLDTKTLKLCAREEYDADHDKFAYDFFADEYGAASDTAQLTRFNKILLRNGGQDRYTSFVKSFFSEQLADSYGINGLQKARPVIVFLNGEYYSIAQLMPAFSNDYLAETYGLCDQELIETYEYSDITAFKAAGIVDLFHNDLSQEKYKKALESEVDVESLLKYYAYEMYCNNMDWPGNNVEIWRYSGKTDETTKFADGRFRTLLYDFDKAFIESDGDEQFIHLLDPEKKQDNLLTCLLVNNEYRAYFINCLNYFMSNSGQAQEILEKSDGLIKEYESSPLVGEKVGQSLRGARTEDVDKISAFLENRPETVKGYLKKYFGYTDTYTLAVEKPDAGCTVLFGGAEVNNGTGTYTGTYYCACPVTFTVETAKGYEFVSWEVNGKTVKEGTLTVTGGDIANGKVNIKVNIRRLSEPCLVISELSGDGSSDWVELKNVGGAALDLNGYTLTENPERPGHYQLPEITLQPDEVLLLHCKNNAVYEDYLMNFNLQKGETLYLYRDGEVVDRMAVPAMQKNESYGIDPVTGKTVYFRNPVPGEQG